MRPRLSCASAGGRATTKTQPETATEHCGQTGTPLAQSQLRSAGTSRVGRAVGGGGGGGCRRGPPRSNRRSAAAAAPNDLQHAPAAANGRSALSVPPAGTHRPRGRVATAARQPLPWCPAATVSIPPARHFCRAVADQWRAAPVMFRTARYHGPPSISAAVETAADV